MRATRAVLAILCAAGAVTAAATTATASPAAPRAVTAATDAAAPSGSNWLPSTPAYWPLVVRQHATSPQAITKGVDVHSETYQTVGGAQRAQIMNVDLTDPNVRFGAVEAGDKLIDPSDETISSMANRTGAVAGVNSDFFAINTTGQPTGMLVQNGVLEASPVPSWP